MSNRGQLYLGIVIILVGVMWLVGNLFSVDVWRVFWPVLIIVLGLALLVRPRLFQARGGTTRFWVIGDIRRRGAWRVTDEEFWMGIGDVRLDLTEADIPSGETHIRVWLFVGDVWLTVPEGVGVSVSASGFIVDARILGRHYERFLGPVLVTSDDYESAGRKVRIETVGFVGDVCVRRAESSSAA